MTDRCPHCECYLEGNSHYCLTLDQRVYHGTGEDASMDGRLTVNQLREGEGSIPSLPTKTS